MTIFSFAISRSFSLGSAFPSLMRRFRCFLLQRFLKYTKKPMPQRRKMTAPHMLPAMIGVRAFFLKVRY
jgi:hypothetical protein